MMFLGQATEGAPTPVPSTVPEGGSLCLHDCVAPVEDLKPEELDQEAECLMFPGAAGQPLRFPSSGPAPAPSPKEGAGAV